MDTPRFHPLDYLSAARRRKWWLIVPVVVAVLAGLVLVLTLPRQYLSSATIGITSAAISPDIARVAAPFDREERLRAISQQLLSKPVLTRVAREEHLATDEPTLDAVLARLRRSVQP